jgi:hypothetical protein
MVWIPGSGICSSYSLEEMGFPCAVGIFDRVTIKLEHYLLVHGERFNDGSYSSEES